MFSLFYRLLVCLVWVGLWFMVAVFMILLCFGFGYCICVVWFGCLYCCVIVNSVD